MPSLMSQFFQTLVAFMWQLVDRKQEERKGRQVVDRDIHVEDYSLH